MFESIGLTPTAEAVYRVILRHRDWNSTQIAEHLKLSTGETTSVLKELAHLGLLAPAEATDLDFRPVNPALGLMRLIADAEAEGERRRWQISNARAAMAVFSAEVAESATREGFVRLDGVDAVRERLEEIVVSTKRECLTMHPVASQSVSAKMASKPLNQLLLERGVSLHCLYQESFSNDARLVEYAQWLTGLGGVVRTLPVVPLQIIIYDREGVLLPIDPDATHLGAIDTTGAGIVATACALFEQMWQTARPYGDDTPRDDEELSPTEHQLLILLAAGHTDEVVARHLGVSLSTVRRLMAGLMERLPARSRFQAGVKAAERGWLRQLT
jgi:DNA-binding CsgD family transcriptional regulator/sugar-specific transcriptional regulator TrmB